MPIDTFSPQAYESSKELKERSAAAREELMRAGKEYSYWSLQRAYALVRAQFPAVTSLVVDATDWAYPELTSVTAGATELWSLSAPGNAEILQNENDCRLLEADLQLRHALWYERPNRLPGWSVQRDRPGIYVAELAALPSPLNVRRKNGARAALQAGMPGLLHETLNVWSGRFPQAAYEYCRGLVEGRYQALTSIADWKAIPAALGHPVPEDDVREIDQISAEDWTIGITAVHGLAAGVVMCDESGEGFGSPTELAAPVQIYQVDLSKYGLRLSDVARAFGGNVRAAAVAIVRSQDVAERR